jgi:hypothetical protein
VLATLLKNGADYSDRLHAGGAAAGALATKVVVADAAGAATFTDLAIRGAAGANFSLLFSAPNASVESGLFRVLPAALAFAHFPGEARFAPGERRANLSFAVELADAAGNVLPVAAADGFAVAVKLQVGGSGLDMGSAASFANAGSNLQANLLPAGARGAGVVVDGGAANFSGAAALQLGNMAGRGFRLRAFLVSDPAVEAFSDPFSIVPAALALSAPDWEDGASVPLSGPFAHGACDITIGYDEAKCATFGGTWTANAAAFASLTVSLLDGAGETLTGAWRAPCRRGRCARGVLRLRAAPRARAVRCSLCPAIWSALRAANVRRLSNV